MSDATLVGGLEVGCLPDRGGRDTAGILRAARHGKVSFLWLLGADDLPLEELEDTFVVYQGSHGDKGASIADVILPGAAYSEKSATYVNFEGRPQMTMRAVFPPGEAREDWTIIRALSEHIGKRLPFDNIMELHRLVYEQVPHLAALGEVRREPVEALQDFARQALHIQPAAFVQIIDDFYQTNPIARASTIMAEMSTLRHERDQAKKSTREERALIAHD